MATEHQIADPIGAATAARQGMINFEGLVCRLAVGTTPLELFQQVGSRFPSGQLTALVLDARHLCILQQLRVKLDALHLHATKWHPSLVSFCPGEHVPNPSPERRCHPPRPIPPISKTV